jgi:UDP-3-O-[3-hydroxymyristoyl] N-acetylglucosamine deacetylase
MSAQSTLRAPCSFDGVGLHTGAQVSVEIRPAPVDSGIVFVVEDGTRIPATSEHVVDTSRATVIGRDGLRISTVEHLLSALFGMGVCNAEVVVIGPEIPVLDGSARVFTDAIAHAGIELQTAAQPVLELDEPYVLRDGDRAIIALPADELRVRFIADFSPPVGAQYFDGVITPDTYYREICSARTFGYLKDVEALRARGLARGGSLDNALVIGPDGPLQPLRWPNEIVRHKVLDLLGDLALLGAHPLCDIIAIKSGHALHTRAVQDLCARIRRPLSAAKAR